MANIFLWSDPHLDHAATIFKFVVDGKPMRPFASVEEMNETIIARCNERVRPQDKLYCLGDVAMKKSAIALMGRINGHKRLVRGNHDIFDDKYYRPYFDAIYGSRLLDNLLLTHIPVHPDSLRGDWVNVHGHVHNNVGPHHYGPRYFNVCVEVTDYYPLSLEEVKTRIAQQRKENDDIVNANLKRLGITRRWTDEELMREVQR